MGLPKHLLSSLQKIDELARPSDRASASFKCLEFALGWISARILSHVLTLPQRALQVRRAIDDLSSPTMGKYLGSIRTFIEHLGVTSCCRPEISFWNAEISKDQQPAVLAAFTSLATHLGTPRPNRTTVGTDDLVDVMIAQRNRWEHGSKGHTAADAVHDHLAIITKAIMETYSSSTPAPVLLVKDVQVMQGSRCRHTCLLDTGLDRKVTTLDLHVDERLEPESLYAEGESDPHARLHIAPIVQLKDDNVFLLSRFNTKGRSLFWNPLLEDQISDTQWDLRLRELFELDTEPTTLDILTTVTGVTHNLPASKDYYQGFVGRDNLMLRMDEFMNPDFQIHIIALDGIGGVGKTSLARAYCEGVANRGVDSAVYFDHIVWCSAKQRRLLETVEVVKPDIQVLDDLLNLIWKVLGEPENRRPMSTERKACDVRDMLSATRCLIVVDNFETVKDKERVWQFLVRVPRPSKVVVTSRETHQSGAFEVPVRELDDGASRQVLLDECKSFNVELTARFGEEGISKLLRLCGGIPLLMKHAAIQLSAGKTPRTLETIWSQGGQGFEYCFRETFQLVDDISKRTWLALGLFGRPAYTHELMHVLDTTRPDLEAAINGLRRFHVVLAETTADGDQIHSCLPPTVSFARSEARKTEHRALLNSLQDYQDLARRIDQEDVTKKSVRSLTQTERRLSASTLAKELVRRAEYSLYNAKYPEALSILERAESFDQNEPRVWELRARIYEEQGDSAAADEAYKRALECNPDSIATLTRYANLNRNMGRYATALEQYRRIADLRAPNPWACHMMAEMCKRLAKDAKSKNDRNRFTMRMREAIEHYQRGYYDPPKDPREAHHNSVNAHACATAYLLLDAPEEARKHCVRGLHDKPESQELEDLLEHIR